MNWRGYIVLSSIPDPAARERVHHAATQVGRQKADNPSRITHGRVSLDGAKMLIEGEFTEAELKDMRELISANASLSAAQKGALRIEILGGLTVKTEDGERATTYEESHAATLKYLATNRDEWEPKEEAEARK